jgi:hypothetical protein
MRKSEGWRNHVLKREARNSARRIIDGERRNATKTEEIREEDGDDAHKLTLSSNALTSVVRQPLASASARATPQFTAPATDSRQPRAIRSENVFGLRRARGLGIEHQQIERQQISTDAPDVRGVLHDPQLEIEAIERGSEQFH